MCNILKMKQKKFISLNIHILNTILLLLTALGQINNITISIGLHNQKTKLFNKYTKLQRVQDFNLVPAPSCCLAQSAGAVQSRSSGEYGYF